MLFVGVYSKWSNSNTGGIVTQDWDSQGTAAASFLCPCSIIRSGSACCTLTEERLHVSPTSASHRG